MSLPPDELRETPRDAAPAGEIARDETAPGGAGLPPAARETAPNRTGVRVTDDGITEVGFDDPALRPLPSDKLHYHVPHRDAHPEQHEHSDVPIRPLALALGGIAGTCVFTIVLLYFVFWHYKRQQDTLDLPRTAVPMAKPVVPGPRLQGVPGFSDNNDSQDLQALRDHYAARLNSYGRDEGGKSAHIPIDAAMDLAIQRKMFPVMNQKPQASNPKPQAPKGEER